MSKYLTRVGSDLTHYRQKVLLNINIMFDRTKILYPTMIPYAPNAKRIFFYNCDKRTILYSMGLCPDRFPVVKEIYLASHPADISIFYKNVNSPQLFLTENYRRIYEKMVKSFVVSEKSSVGFHLLLKHPKFIGLDEIDDLIQSLQPEDTS